MPEDDRRDLELLLGLLGSVSEVAELLGGDHLARITDAVEIFERLLLDSGLTATRYAELRQRYPAELRLALDVLRSRVQGAGA